MTSWVDIYTQRRNALVSSLGSIGQSSTGNRLPTLHHYQAMTFAGHFADAAMRFFEGQKAIVTIEDESAIDTTWRQAALSSGKDDRPFPDSWDASTVTVRSFFAMAPVQGNPDVRRDPKTFLRFGLTAPYPPPRKFSAFNWTQVTKSYQRLVEALWPPADPLPLVRTQSLFAAAFDLCAALDATDFLAAEADKDTAQLVKDVKDGTRAAVEGVVEAAGEAAGYVANTVGSAAGKGLSGVLSEIGVAGLAVVGVAAYAYSR